MLRYDRQIKLGVVALYDIRAGNRASILTTPEPIRGRKVPQFSFRI